MNTVHVEGQSHLLSDELAKTFMCWWFLYHPFGNTSKQKNKLQVCKAELDA